MKKIMPLMPFIIFILLGIVFYLSIGRDPTLVANNLVGKDFPDFQLESLAFEDQESRPYSLQGLQRALPEGQPWILNVWGSWCPQCYVEHPFITALSDAGVALVGMNYKDETAKGQGFLKKMGNPYQIILQDMEGSLGLDLGVSGAPETYLISPQGEILARHAGVLDKAVWDQKFAKLWQDNNGHQLFSRQSEATEEQGAE
ncbi:MAG: DsbE family thiol:disulfide interchange protein [Pseudomonadota bacterium]|nr:DsbE family thiol:disulfide interchange protein [Pseudomonadota bacterium]